ncbi:DUF4347 domain-containing protein [filamentous cyanobacterium LEGE 11480]|uniref:DUF4347 domain-containing protein n=1 Tax=Romeriopsis navalis LEGE 11480 TaxID=2777977 RepID=A0A928VJA4_9CYAN|nr:DUF4347 domain-containing protein [Romeriopsis navalis]MBE9029631.1 DUF4347 domain-containing protein [Romeriopsis navalis LEGE 11480]
MFKSFDAAAVVFDLSLQASIAPVLGATSVLFVDAGVSQRQLLTQGAAVGTAVYWLDAAQDAVGQITTVLAGYRDLDAVQLVSHGASGGVQLGQTWLDVDNVVGYASQLQTWGEALKATGDLLLYGCRVAANPAGRQLLDQLAQLTGGDVAAADDLTGATALGGDWDLEITTGAIAASSLLVGDRLQDYDHVLQFAQIGVDLDGEAPNDLSGNAVALSADGRTLAIGAYFNDGGGNDSGSVRVYQNVAGTWTSVGLDIDGERSGDLAGYSVALSDDGATVAIGAISNDDNGSDSGSVRVYQNLAGTWTQLGGDIDGATIDEQSGYAVSLAADGRTVAVGAYFNDGNGTDSGAVRIYRYGNNAWTQIGADILGEAAGDQFGNAVSIAADGNTVAITARFNDANGSDSGAVYIYQNVADSWQLVGEKIPGEVAGDTSGNAVALSAAGNVVAIGSAFNDGGGNDGGSVRVYQNLAGTWTQVGADIDAGEAGDLLGWSVALSDDGRVVAIGARGNDANGNDSGAVVVYRNFFGTWQLVDQPIKGEAAEDQSGWSVALSGDGQTVAVGAYLNDGNGSLSGSTRAYDVPSSPAKAEVLWRNTRLGISTLWYVDNATELVAAQNLIYGAGIGDGRVGTAVNWDASWRLAGVADFNGDGVADYLYDNGVNVLITTLGQVAGQTVTLEAAVAPLINGVAQVIPTGWNLVGTADMNGDGIGDLVFRSQAMDVTAVWQMGNTNQVTQAVFVTEPGGAIARTNGGQASPWTIVGLGDFDGDSDVDILYRWEAANLTALWTMNGLQQVSAAFVNLTVGSGFELGGVGDFNGDGVQDLVWRDRLTDQTQLWTFDGNGVATAVVLPGTGSADWQIQAIADMNGDGTDDLIWQNQPADLSAVWIMRNGQRSTGSNLIRNFLPNGNQLAINTGDVSWRLEGATDAPSVT